MKANSKIAQAYERCKPARDALREIDARCMESTEDKTGILWERYVVFISDDKHINVTLLSTPDWWDVFTPITNDMRTDGTVAAIKALVAKK